MSKPPRGPSRPHLLGDRAHQLKAGLHFGPPVDRGGLDHPRVDAVALRRKMLLQARVAQIFRSRPHADVALTGIVRDEQKPYFHFARPSVALGNAPVNTCKLASRIF
jgi:hypothetical protein